MALTIQREMAGHKRVALVAHDNMKHRHYRLASQQGSWVAYHLFAIWSNGW